MIFGSSDNDYTKIHTNSSTTNSFDRTRSILIYGLTIGLILFSLRDASLSKNVNQNFQIYVNQLVVDNKVNKAIENAKEEHSDTALKMLVEAKSKHFKTKP